MVVVALPAARVGPGGPCVASGVAVLARRRRLLLARRGHAARP
ncbi:hypothetical protein SFR_1592 [Streptomyces sp. FR-008]|nr:hypothetical protein SFR_1592 [Streptomyces sp. FR-008]